MALLSFTKNLYNCLEHKQGVKYCLGASIVLLLDRNYKFLPFKMSLCLVFFQNLILQVCFGFKRTPVPPPTLAIRQAMLPQLNNRWSESFSNSMKFWVRVHRTKLSEFPLGIFFNRKWLISIFINSFEFYQCSVFQSKINQKHPFWSKKSPNLTNW